MWCGSSVHVSTAAVAGQHLGKTSEAWQALQCYLKDADARIEADMQRAAAEGWRVGAKTVRGAYMVVEQGRAAERGYESPIWDSLPETHASYNRCRASPTASALQNPEASCKAYVGMAEIKLCKGCKGLLSWCRCVARVLEAVAGGSAELMVASHNQESVALATRRMHELGMQPSTSGEPWPGILPTSLVFTVPLPCVQVVFTLPAKCGLVAGSLSD